MNKTERRELITQLVNDGEDHEDIIREVVAKSGVQESTIVKDMVDIYPDGLPKNAETQPASDIVVEASADDQQKASTQIVERIVERIVYVEAIPETDNGRISPADYEVPKGEEHIVHVEIERTSFNPNTGKKKSVPKVQKFDDRAWLNFKKHAKQQGFIHVRVLHAPDDVDTTVPQ